MNRRNIDLFRISTKGKQTKSISFLCLLLAGIYGILFFLSALEGIYFAGGWIAGVVFFICLGNWYFYTHKRWIFWCFYLAGIGITGLLGYFLREELWIQVQIFVRAWGYMGEKDPVDITLFVLLVALFLCFFVFLLELSSIGHKTMILFTTILLCISPVIGITIQWQTLFVLIFFQIIFYAMHVLERKNRRTIFLSVEQLSGKQRKTADAVTLSMAGLLGLLFCLAIWIAVVKREQIYEMTDQAEGYLYRAAVNAGLRDNSIKDGQISRSNHHQMGVEQLRIRTEQKPTETLYLSGFHGEEYIGGDWTAADNRKIYEEIANQLNWTHWENHIGTSYSGMYYVVNSRMSENPMVNSRTLQIEHINRRDTTYYRPYYSQWQGDAINNYFDYGRYESGYQYRYYEQKDMHIDWFDTASGFEEIALSYLQMQNAYQEVAERVYTQVPEELLPRLSQLCQEHKLSDREEVTAFILYTLHSNAVYTLTPGMAPYGEDIVEYFLFENGRGYCVHFAAAATLMYRMYGIPARYVSGYMVNPTVFQKQEDGSYLAEVTDRSAHAWVEILIPDYGWTPVEVTPAAESLVEINAVGEYPGLDGEELETIFRKYGWNLSIPSLRTEENRKTDTKWYEGEGWFGHLKQSGEYGALGGIRGVILWMEVLFFIPLAVRYWQFFRWDKMEQMGSREIFFEILQILRVGGYLSGYEGWEEDFVEQLGLAVKGIDLEEIRQMMVIVNRIAYGGITEKEEEKVYVRGIYWKIVAAIYRQARGWRRVVFAVLGDTKFVSL